MAGVAYVEGWGLYSERLADEMDLYASDEERLGMLEAQSFRAARLVVDSGLHAMGWTRDQAIEFMHERGSLPMVDAEIEVDRYTIWPGQALAYKLGQREIERARAEVSAAMGERFDLRAFHDEVLGHGSLPLATLRREIPGWVEAAVSAAVGNADDSEDAARKRRAWSAEPGDGRTAEEGVPANSSRCSTSPRRVVVASRKRSARDDVALGFRSALRGEHGSDSRFDGEPTEQILCVCETGLDLDHQQPAVAGWNPTTSMRPRSP